MVDFAYFTWQLSSKLQLCCTPFRPWAFTVSSLVESSLSVTGWHNGDVVNPSISPRIASICLTINAQPTAGWHHTHTASVSSKKRPDKPTNPPHAPSLPSSVPVNFCRHCFFSPAAAPPVRLPPGVVHLDRRHADRPDSPSPQGLLSCDSRLPAAFSQAPPLSVHTNEATGFFLSAHVVFCCFFPPPLSSSFLLQSACHIIDKDGLSICFSLSGLSRMESLNRVWRLTPVALNFRGFNMLVDSHCWEFLFCSIINQLRVVRSAPPHSC